MRTIHFQPLIVICNIVITNKKKVSDMSKFLSNISKTSSPCQLIHLMSIQ